jgi:hypothetical protein
MEPFVVTKTEDTPQIDFNLNVGVFLIAGRSLPENAIEFYKPVFSWVEKALGQSDGKSISVNIKLEYFNTASSKQIAKLFLLLEEFINKHAVIVNWFYEKEDNDMLISGSQYAKFLNLKFEFIEVESL